MWVEWESHKKMYRQDWGTCQEKSRPWPGRGQYLEWDTRDPDRHHVSPCLGFCQSPPPSPPSLGGASELYPSQNHKIGQVISYTCITGHQFENITATTITVTAAATTATVIAKVAESTVRSLAQICSSTTSTMFAEPCFQQSHTAKQRLIMRKDYYV